MLLRDFVNMKMASADKEASAEGVPLTLNNCKKYKKMRDLKVYGNSVQDTATYGTPSVDNPVEIESVGELVTDETDSNYGKYKIPVVQRGKNLFNPQKAIISTSVVAITHNADGSFNLKGTSPTVNPWCYYFSISKSYCIERFIPKATTVYVSVTAENQTENFYIGLAFYDIDGNIVRQNIKMVNGTKWAYTTTTDIYYIGFVWTTGVYTNLAVEMTNIKLQVELGDTYTEFEPYVEPITTNIYLDEPLRKLSSYADYIDYKNNKVVRNIKEYNLAIADMDMDDEAFPGWRNPDELVSVVGTGVNLPITTLLNISNLIGANTNGTPRLFLSKSRYGLTQTEWKTTYPDLIVQILLERITPKEEPLNIDLPKLNAKTTIIEVDTSLAPSNISGKYILR